MPDDAIAITLFGGLEVSGTDVPLPSRALSLLACLAAREGSPQPRAHLAGLLWPDSTEQQARTNLRRELHHLRGALGDSEALVVQPHTLTWRETDRCSVDVAAFLVARRRALAALGAGDAATFAVQARRALALHQGELLPGWYDEWVLAAREELHDACVDLCRQGVSRRDPPVDPDLATELARHWIALEPVEESGYRHLARLQRAAGDRAGAISTYHRCVDVLEQELGVPPSPETRRELAGLLHDGDDGGLDRRPGRSGVVPDLVGREAERALLLDAWRSSGDGGRFVLVVGEPGAGKTRLVADLASQVRRHGGVVASARCFPTTGGLPLAPVAEWLRDPRLARATRRLPHVWQAEVARLVPHDGDRAAATSDARSTGTRGDTWRRLRFFEGLARGVLAVGRPLLLTLDDLQWSDGATVAWLAFLLRFARDAPVLVVATAREDDLGGAEPTDRLATMRAAGAVTTLALGPLPADAVADLARQTSGRDLAPEELALLRSLTGDNPFHVIEALRETVSRPGPLTGRDLHDVLAGRLARLSEQARQVVGLASAVGRDFDLDLLTEASDLAPDVVVSHVDDLWRRRILDRRGRGYDFAHDLIREAAYARLEPARRWLLHRRIAQALELLHAGHLDAVASDLADQYVAGGRPERALPFYERAARQAAAVFAHAEAVRLWDRSLDLLATLPETAERDRRELEMLEQLLPPLNALRGYADATLEAHERRCHELGLRLGLPRVQASAATALWATTFVQGRIAESGRWGGLAAELSEQFPDLAAKGHFCVAGSALSVGRVATALDRFEASCLLAGESDMLPIGSLTAVHARAWWAHALWLSGDADGAARACTEAIRHARSVAHPYSLAIALAYTALTEQFRSDRESLARTLAELTELCERHGFAYYREWPVVLGGWLAGGAEGLAAARAGIAALRETGAQSRMPYWLSLVADLHVRRGDVEAGVATLDAAAAYAARSDDVWWLPEVLRARGVLTPGRRGVRDLQRADQLAQTHGSTGLSARCRADLAARGTRVRPAV